MDLVMMHSVMLAISLGSCIDGRGAAFQDERVIEELAKEE